MQNDLSNGFTEQASKMVEPLQKMQSAWVSNLQAFSNFQIKAMEDYAKLGMAQLKTAVDIKEPQDYQAYSSAQNELLKTVQEKVVEDNKQLTQMAQTFIGELDSIWKESLPIDQEQSQDEAKNTAKKKAA